MENRRGILSLPRTPKSSGLPYVLATLVAGVLASTHCSAAAVPWRICEVYSNADGSSQLIQLCGGSDGLPYSPEMPLFHALLTAGNGSSTQRFLLPNGVTGYYDSHRVLVGTQGFADLNLIKPDFVVPNGFLPLASGSISLANYDSVTYVGLPADGFHAIDTDVSNRPGDGDPSSAITLATAANVDFQSYGFSGPRSTDVAGGRWVPTSSMNAARIAHSATLLPNGKVLVAGGAGGPPSYEALATAELYDPATGTWSATGSMKKGRSDHSATLLPNGKVLVVDASAADAELYDPTAGAWTVVGGRSGFFYGPITTLLKSGRVLVAGGPINSRGTFTADAAALLYDPATGSWSSTANFNIVREQGQRATLLNDGRVLLTGGTIDVDYAVPLRSAETYDPITGAWSVVAPLHFGRSSHVAILLASGEVLVVGNTSVTEVFDPASGKWTVTGPRNVAANDAKAVLLSDGRVLVEGGYRVDADGQARDASGAEVYDPQSRTWLKTADPNNSRSGHTMTLLRNGKVLVVGGSTGLGSSTDEYLRSAELFEPGPTQVALGPGFTGSWFNPEQNGHGFALEVLAGHPMQLLASWFAFAPQGGQAWIVGLGPIDGNRAVLRGSQSVGPGGRFPPNFDMANVQQQDWGMLTFTFSDCNHGHVDWASSAPGYGSGSMDLTRLTLPAGLTCSP